MQQLFAMQMQQRRPPRGGRGLKFLAHLAQCKGQQSPSSRRAWIEILMRGMSGHSATVALLAEGVD